MCRYCKHCCSELRLPDPGDKKLYLMCLVLAVILLVSFSAGCGCSASHYAKFHSQKYFQKCESRNVAGGNLLKNRGLQMLDARNDCDCDFLIENVDKKFAPIFIGFSQREKRAIYRYHFSNRPQKLPPSLKSRIANLYDPLSDRSSRFLDGLRFCINTAVGCEHDCGYCYVNGYSQKNVGISPHEKRDFEKRLVKDLNDLKVLGVPAAPLHESNSTDPCQADLESRHRHTLFTLNQIAKYRSQFSSIVMLTKNPAMLCEDAYLSIITQESFQPFTVQVSCAFGRDEPRKYYEPNAPSIKSRLEAVQLLAEAGINVELRIDPLFPSTRIEESIRLHKDLSHYGLLEAQTEEDIINLVQFAKKAGVRKIVGKPLKVSISKRAQKCKDWFSQLYADSYPDGKRKVQGGSWRLPKPYQHALINSVKQVCESEGIAFTHCRHDVLERK